MSLSPSICTMVHVVLDMRLQPAWLIKPVQRNTQSSLNQKLSLDTVAILNTPDLTMAGPLSIGKVILMIIGILFLIILILQPSMVSLPLNFWFFSLMLIN